MLCHKRLLLRLLLSKGEHNQQGDAGSDGNSAINPQALQLPLLLERAGGEAFLNSKEVELIQKMSEYGAAVEQAGKDYSPSGIANYCYELTKVFNQFYHDYSILNEPDEQKKAVRLVLAKNVAKIIKSGMSLLGIEVPERM